MFTLDFHTIFLIYVFTEIVGTIIILMLYFQNRKRFDGVKFLLWSFILHTSGTILILFREFIPDWLSIVCSNTLSVSSTLLLLIGLERFAGKRGPQAQNYLLIAVFFLIQSYFTFIKPDLQIRNLNVTLAFLILTVQIIWLCLKRVSDYIRKFTWFVGLVFCAFGLTLIYRLILFVLSPQHEVHYFNSHLHEKLFILITELIFLFYIFSLILMFNKRLRLEIEFQEEKFSKAFHASPNAYILSRLDDGIIFEANDGFYKLFGYQISEVCGKSTFELRLWKNPEERPVFINQLLANEKVSGREVVFQTKNGNFINCLLSAEIILIHNEKCIISAISDVTNLKNTEQILQSQKEELKELVATKDKFFSIIAHDLKSPFNSILGFSNELRENAGNLTTETIGQYAQTIYNSAEQSYYLLENLLEWARMQQGKIQFHPEPLDLKKIVEKIIELFQENANTKKLTLENRLTSSVFVTADENMLKTILRNLVQNAIKFTEESGKVEIGTIGLEQGIEVYVKDTGRGIPPEHISKLFQLNSDFSTPGTNNEKGTGLGLLLCHEFAAVHGSSLTVSSEVGKGSRFGIVLQQAEKNTEYKQ